MVKGDIALLSYLPGGSTRREVGHGWCTWDSHFRGVSNGTVQKIDSGFL